MAASNPRATLGSKARRAVLALAMLSGCAQVPRHGFVSPEMSEMAYALEGPASAPVVVLQSGLGDGRASWSPIWAGVVSRARTFALDRPGYGESPQRSIPRDPCQVARELRAALREAQVAPPYLLVGHSLGGLYQWVFARMYPQDTAGLLLLDPTHPDHWETMQREAPEAAKVVRGLRATLFTPTMKAEFDDQATCLQGLPAGGPAAMPVRLLVSTRFSAIEGAAYQRALQRLRLDWQERLGAPALEAVPNAGHYIHHDAPERVLLTLDEMLAHRVPPPR